MSESNHPIPLSLEELAERCEAAECSTRDLDGLIFITVTPGVADAGRIDQIGGVVGWWPKNKPYQSARDVPAYTISIDAAASLVGGDAFTLGQNVHHYHWVASVNALNEDGAVFPLGSSNACRSAAMALCAAALRAMGRRRVVGDVPGAETQHRGAPKV